MDTILIFGCSDRLLDWHKWLLKGLIPIKNPDNNAGHFSEQGEAVFDELKNYVSIGLNRFPEFFPFVDYRIWIDNSLFGNCVYKLTNNNYKPFLFFEPNINLFGAYTVASFALDFAIKQGFKRAVLYGILDGEYKLIEKKGIHLGHWEFSYRHFYEDQPGKVTMYKLQQFKNIIFSYRNKIQVEIPYRTI